MVTNASSCLFQTTKLTYFNYNPGRCTTFKDLGVSYDTKLSFATPNMERVHLEATKTIEFILRNAKEFTCIQALKHYTLVM